MNNRFKIFFILIMLLIESSTNAQINISISSKSKGLVPKNNQIVVKFRPDLINQEIVNNREIVNGVLSDFVNPKYLEFIINSGYFNEQLANLPTRKIFRKMTTADNLSVNRIGEKVHIPEFWSTLLIEWDKNLEHSFEGTIDTLNLLQPFIYYAHENYKIELHGLPNDANFVGNNQAGLWLTKALPDANINIEPAWDISVGSPTCKVGVYDSGINWDHEDMMYGSSTSGFSNSVVIGGWDWINNSPPGIDVNHDKDGHGSAVGAIIGARRNNLLGGAGIAGGNDTKRGVQIFSMKVFNANSTLFSVVSEGIVEGAASNNPITNFGYGLNIMNVSNGRICLPNQKCDSKSVLYDAVKFAFENSVVFVASAGNDGLLSNPSPANYPASFNDSWVLKTGASNKAGNRDKTSSNGYNLDFLAPGEKGLSTGIAHDNNKTYNVDFDGTSSAAPHVSGVAALMLSYIQNSPKKSNDLAAEDVEHLLQNYATDIGLKGYDDDSGFGLINAGKTLQGIQLPRYEVKHYSTNYDKSNCTLLSTNGSTTKIILTSASGNISAGTYIAKLWQVDVNIDIAQQKGRKILDVWVRNASSDGLPYSQVLPNLYVNNETEITIIKQDKNIVYLRCYIYQVINNILGQSLDEWIPSSGLMGKIGITVYTEDGNLVNTVNAPISSELVSILPNPSLGNFRLLFGLQKSTNLCIQLVDISGKVVYLSPKKFENEGHKDISLNIDNLNNGLYFCNIITDEGVITKKITIIR